MHSGTRTRALCNLLTASLHDGILCEISGYSRLEIEFVLDSQGTNIKFNIRTGIFIQDWFCMVGPVDGSVILSVVLYSYKEKYIRRLLDGEMSECT